MIDQELERVAMEHAVRFIDKHHMQPLTFGNEPVNVDELQAAFLSALKQVQLQPILFQAYRGEKGAELWANGRTIFTFASEAPVESLAEILNTFSASPQNVTPTNETREDSGDRKAPLVEGYIRLFANEILHSDDDGCTCPKESDAFSCRCPIHGSDVHQLPVEQVQPNSEIKEIAAEVRRIKLAFDRDDGRVEALEKLAQRIEALSPSAQKGGT